MEMCRSVLVLLEKGILMMVISLNIKEKEEPRGAVVAAQSLDPFQ